LAGSSPTVNRRGHGLNWRKISVTQIAICLQRLVDDVFQLGRNVAIEPDCRRRIRIQYGIEDQRSSFTMERQRSRCHFVQNRAEGKQVGAGIQLLALGLLRGHVGNCTERGTRAGQVIRIHRTGRGVERSDVARRTARHTDLRQSEVQNLGVTTLGDENVRRLDVAMDDALRMRGIEGVGNLDGERENQFGFERTPSDAMLQRHAVEKLHGDEVLPFALVNLEDHADVGVVQGGRRLCFALEPCESLRVLGDFIGQEFQGDGTMQLFNESRGELLARFAYVGFCSSDRPNHLALPHSKPQLTGGQTAQACGIACSRQAVSVCATHRSREKVCVEVSG
jgi:hypothetical protein